MAGWDPQMLTPTLTSGPGPTGNNGGGTLGGAAVQPHHGLIGMVGLAVLVLVLLDRAGFRFAVTTGKR